MEVGVSNLVEGRFPVRPGMTVRFLDEARNDKGAMPGMTFFS